MRDMEYLETQLLEYLTRTFGDLELYTFGQLSRAAREVPQQAAIVGPAGDGLNYSDLLELANHTVSRLNSLGLTVNSRVAIALPTTVEAAPVYVSVMAGMTIMLLNPDLGVAACRRYLEHVAADAVLIWQDQTLRIKEAAEHLAIPVIEVMAVPEGPLGRFVIVGANANAPTNAQFAGPDDIAVIIPTSGTTDLPKLVPLTQRLLAMRTYTGITPSIPKGSVVFNTLPFYHTMGFDLLMTALIAQRRLACSPQFVAAQVYSDLLHYKVLSLSVVPAMLEALVAAASYAAALQQLWLKEIYVSAATLPQQTLLAILRVLGAVVTVGYGMTETYSITAMEWSQDNVQEKAGTVGKPLSFVEVRIEDPVGMPVPTGATGEIVLRSALLFAGYSNDAQVNDETFRDGWFHTGDQGYFDADGYLFISGRMKELINRGGSKVAPEEVDAIMKQHPDVVDAACFGFPHQKLGEDVAVAIVAARPGMTEAQLRLYAVERLPNYKVPSRFVFIDEIPKTSLGKVQRQLLSTQFGPLLKR